MSNDDKIRLKVLGLSRTPIRSDAYALILGQVGGTYRIPIVIGTTEAQSIAIALDRVITPRPITHDLFCSLSHAFGLELVEVYIYQFHDGIFSAEMLFTDGEREVHLDSRTSDAIAIAIRMDTPIYTTREILEETGTQFVGNLDTEDNSSSDNETPAHNAVSPNAKGYEDMTDAELQEELQKNIADENYEEAAKISEIIKKRNI